MASQQWFLLLLLFLLPLTQAGTLSFSSSSTLNQYLQDANSETGVKTITSTTLTVSGLPTSLTTATLITLRININHARPGTIILTIKSPSGTVKTLSNQQGNYCYLTYKLCSFKETGTMVTTSIPTTGSTCVAAGQSYIPLESLQTLTSENLNGVWTFSSQDMVVGDAGTLYDWGIDFQSGCLNASPCLNGGTCVPTTASGYTGYTCSCPAGYNGATCQTDVNECAGSNSCHPNATCTNTVGSYTCACKSGFSGNGISCTDNNECAGSNSCHANATCTNTVGSYTCACKNGFSGNGTSCTDNNECAGSNPCHPNATCTNTIGSYTCACKNGFSGDGTSCADIDECAQGNHNCSSNAICTNTVGSFSCACVDGFFGNGYSCSACQCGIGSTGSSCNAAGNCTCRTGFQGTKCDECQAGRYGSSCTSCPDCQHGACLEGISNNGSCQCDPGFALGSVVASSFVCDACAAKHFGPSCQACPECNAGLCFAGITGNGTCICPTGWKNNGTSPCSICETNYVLVGDACLGCHPSCSSCSGTSSTDCLSCPSNLVYSSNDHTCTSNCSIGTYSEGGVCTNCSSSCFECSGPGAGSCISCKNGFVFDNGNCLSSCQTPATFNQNGVCKPCPGKCSACSSDGPGGCTACASSLLVLDAGNCLLACSKTNSYVSGGICHDCNSTCATCSGPSGNNCLSCSAPLGLIGSTCVDKCPSHQFIDATQKCQDCYPVCATCNGSSYSSCTSCDQASPYKYLDNSVCLSQCSNFRFAPDQTNVCISCNCNQHSGTCNSLGECQNCLGNTQGRNCESCKEGFERSSPGNLASDCSDINECTLGTSSVCHPNASCSNTLGSFICTCNQGYVGDGFNCTDQNECSTGTHNCDVHADCINTVGSYSCACKAGFDGDGFNCIDFDECTQKSDNCHPQALCSNTEGSFTCICNTGFQGNGTFCADSNECVLGTSLCNQNAQCTNTFGSYSCACKPGYNGDGINSCQDNNECTLGTDSCSSDSVCVNTVGSYDCICSQGFQSNGTSCIDIDECSRGIHSCSAHATCNNLIGGYTCICNEGYSGNGFNCTVIGDETKNRNNGAVIGGVIGGILGLLIFFVLLSFLWIRRKRYENRKTRVPSSFELDKMASRRTTKTFSASDTLGSGPSRDEGANATMLNTKTEIALPGYLLIDLSRQLRTEEHLAVGGAGSLSIATVIDQVLRNENEGNEKAVVKEVQPISNFTEEQNAMLFQQEVAAMSALRYHHHIAKLLGFSNTPRAIVTPLYAGDLSGYIHRTDSFKDLPEDHFIPVPFRAKLVYEIVDAFTAIHSIGVVHRDLKPKNLLLEEYPHSEYPYKIKVSDFGICRIVLDQGIKNQNFLNIFGISTRYAAPEVFSRSFLPGVMNDAEDEKKVDVYSFAICVWELLTNRFPWNEVGNEEVQRRVCSGERPATPHVNPSVGEKEIQQALIDLTLRCWEHNFHARPSFREVLTTLQTLGFNSF